MKQGQSWQGFLGKPFGNRSRGAQGFSLRPKRRAFELVLLCALSSTAWLASASMFSEREVGPLGYPQPSKDHMGVSHIDGFRVPQNR